jgi:type VI secretion system protein VasJ
LEELSTLLQEKLANNNPGLVDLNRALQNRFSELERKAAPPAATVASPTAAVPAEETFPSEITTVEQADSVFPKVQDAAFQIASAWRAADPTDPRPYTLTRALMWGEILQPPPAEEGLTQIPGVRPELIEAWETMLSEENFADLLEAAESYFGQTVFWFDLHRYVVRAMDALGGEYAGARAAVVGQLRSFLARLPEVVDFKFSDETPYASDATQKWLKAEVLSGGGGAPASPEPAGPSATAVSEKLAEAVKKAGELAKKKKVNEAVNLFQEGIKSTTEKREQFIWRLGLARFCLNAKLPQVAIPHLEQLEREIGRFSLDDWEPQLALEALVLLHKAYKKAIDEDKAFPDTEEKAQKLFARLCQLDPMMALNLGKK